MKRPWSYLMLMIVPFLLLALLLPPGEAQEPEAEKRAAGRTDYLLYCAEYLTAADSGQLGRTVFFSDVGNKQLLHHFVPGDPRRGGFTDITYIVDTFDGATSSGLPAGATTAAINRAMSTWDAQKCSTIPITNFGAFNFDFGVEQFLRGFGGAPFVFADITHAGWLPKAFFDTLAPGGGDFILGVTFTFVFIDGSGDPTDIDNNGKLDTAFREIYYNDNFFWDIDGNVDVETVALHESGHGLSQAHFGKAFITNKNGKIHFAPRAVMNASYSGVQQTLKESDKGGHCSIWGSWPNN